MVEMKQISRVGGSRNAPKKLCFGGTIRRSRTRMAHKRVFSRDRTVGRSPRDRRRLADMGRVARKPENFVCKNAQKGNGPKMQFASFGVLLRVLSGASCDASEEVFVIRPSDVWKRA